MGNFFPILYGKHLLVLYNFSAGLRTLINQLHPFAPPLDGSLHWIAAIAPPNKSIPYSIV